MHAFTAFLSSIECSDVFEECDGGKCVGFLGVTDTARFLDDFSDWEWNFPYVFTLAGFLLNNLFNIILWLAGKIC